MHIVSDTDNRELDQRSADGIDVTLFWNRTTNRVWVAVADGRRGHGFELDVDPSDALDAFRHPYAYAVRDVEDYALAA